MKKVYIIIAVTTIFTLGISSCKKNGTGGESEISVWVKHHETLIPGATVYVKYGAMEFPGTDLSKYDVSKVCGISGHGAGHTHFKELLRGNYYLYAVGYDSTISKAVTGGLYVKVKKNDDHIETDVAVKEH
jgi:hypothetical protein